MPRRMQNRSALPLFCGLRSKLRKSRKVGRMRYFPNPHYMDAVSGARKVTKEWLQGEIINMVNQIMAYRASRTDFASGVYVGVAGNAYGVFTASTFCLQDFRKEQYQSFAAEAIAEHLKYCEGHSCKQLRDTQFFLGSLGVYVVKIIFDYQTKNYINQEVLNIVVSAVDVVCTDNYMDCGCDEMLVGRAGFLAAILNLRMQLNVDVISDNILKKVMDKIIDSGRKYAYRKRSPSALMYQYYGNEYLGAAHGLMGILQMLLSFPHLLDALALRDIETTLDWLLNIQTSDGNFPPNVNEIGFDRKDEELVHWCHGATGAVHLFIVAYLHFKRDKFLKAAEKCLNLIWKKGVLRKGPGICHGVAGSGYAFLLYYRLTHDEKYLLKARCFANIVRDPDFISKARTPDSPFSLYEGISGTLCFFCSLYDPMKAQFPLVPIPFP